MSDYLSKFNPWTKKLQWILNKSSVDKLAEGTPNEVSATELISGLYNIVLLAFYRAVDTSKTLYNLLNGFIDEYEDQSGIDLDKSDNITYFPGGHYYQPKPPGLDTHTSLLLHFNGDNDQTTTDDETGNHTITMQGTLLKTAEKKFGSASCYFPGSTRNRVEAIPDLPFGNHPFTIDWWCKPVFSYGCMFALNRNQDIPTTGYSAIHLHIESNGVVSYHFSSSGSGWLWGGGFGQVPNDGQWHHCALVREPTAMKFYIDGKSAGSFGVATQSLYGGRGIGSFLGTQSGGYQYSGYMDEVRISLGVARWTAEFTPPTSEYTSDYKNMTLISEKQTAESEPSSARIIVFEEDINEITLNTDLKALVSKDDGSTWAEGTLQNEGKFEGEKRVLTSLVDLSLSGIGSGTDMVYKLVTDNEKGLKIHGTALLWD